MEGIHGTFRVNAETGSVAEIVADVVIPEGVAFTIAEMLRQPPPPKKAKAIFPEFFGCSGAPASQRVKGMCCGSNGDEFYCCLTEVTYLFFFMCSNFIVSTYLEICLGWRTLLMGKRAISAHFLPRKSAQTKESDVL